MISLVLAACIAPAWGQGLSPEEVQIISIVESQASEAIDFLEVLVNINSGTMNHKGVRKTGQLFDEAFSKIGFDTEWIPMPKQVNRAGHFFATHKGRLGKRILLIGHLDTVFEKDSPFQKFSRNDTLAFGPGINDMKGGDIIILYALKALSEAGLLEDRQIIVAFTGDEESPGKPTSVGRHDLVEAAKKSDIALGYETSVKGYAVVARRGSSGWRLDVQGPGGHSSGIFNEESGSGAIFEAARILNSFHEEVRGEANLTFNPGVMLGGTEVAFDKLTDSGTAFGKTNVIAQTVVVNGGLRFLSEEQKENARAKMAAIAAQNLPHTSATMTLTDSYPAMPPTDGNYALLEVIDQVSRDLGQGPLEAYDPGLRGAADISFIAQYVDALGALGIEGRGAHSPRENMDIASLVELTKRTAILLYRLTR
jgi:glutamate carboxypeptidase